MAINFQLGPGHSRSQRAHGLSSPQSLQSPNEAMEAKHPGAFASWVSNRMLGETYLRALDPRYDAPLLASFDPLRNYLGEARESLHWLRGLDRRQAQETPVEPSFKLPRHPLMKLSDAGISGFVPLQNPVSSKPSGFPLLDPALLKKAPTERPPQKGAFVPLPGENNSEGATVLAGWAEGVGATRAGALLSWGQPVQGSGDPHFPWLSNRFTAGNGLPAWLDWQGSLQSGNSTVISPPPGARTGESNGNPTWLNLENPLGKVVWSGLHLGNRQDLPNLKFPDAIAPLLKDQLGISGIKLPEREKPWWPIELPKTLPNFPSGKFPEDLIKPDRDKPWWPIELPKTLPNFPGGKFPEDLIKPDRDKPWWPIELPKTLPNFPSGKFPEDLIKPERDKPWWPIELPKTLPNFPVGKFPEDLIKPDRDKPWWPIELPKTLPNFPSGKFPEDLIKPDRDKPWWPIELPKTLPSFPVGKFPEDLIKPEREKPWWPIELPKTLPNFPSGKFPEDLIKPERDKPWWPIELPKTLPNFPVGKFPEDLIKPDRDKPWWPIELPKTLPNFPSDKFPWESLDRELPREKRVDLPEWTKSISPFSKNVLNERGDGTPFTSSTRGMELPAGSMPVEDSLRRSGGGDSFQREPFSIQSTEDGFSDSRPENGRKSSPETFPAPPAAPAPRSLEPPPQPSIPSSSPESSTASGTTLRTVPEPPNKPGPGSEERKNAQTAPPAEPKSALGPENRPAPESSPSAAQGNGASPASPIAKSEAEPEKLGGGTVATEPAAKSPARREEARSLALETGASIASEAAPFQPEKARRDEERSSGPRAEAGHDASIQIKEESLAEQQETVAQQKAEARSEELRIAARGAAAATRSATSGAVGSVDEQVATATGKAGFGAKTENVTAGGSRSGSSPAEESAEADTVKLARKQSTALASSSDGSIAQQQAVASHQKETDNSQRQVESDTRSTRKVEDKSDSLGGSAKSGRGTESDQARRGQTQQQRSQQNSARSESNSSAANTRYITRPQEPEEADNVAMSDQSAPRSCDQCGMLLGGSSDVACPVCSSEQPDLALRLFTQYRQAGSHWITFADTLAVTDRARTTLEQEASAPVQLNFVPKIPKLAQVLRFNQSTPT